MAISKEKILEALAKNGIEGEEAEKIIADIEGEEPEEETAGKPEETGAPIEESEEEIAPQVREDEEPEEPSAPEVDPSQEINEPFSKAKHEETAPIGDDVPPVEEPANEVPPVEETPAPVPPVPEEPVAQPEPTPGPAPVPQPYDDTEIRNALEEKDKVIDALTKRVDSLEQALREGGILSDENSEEGEPVGIDNPKVPAGEPIDDPMSDVLARINHKRY